MLLGLLLGVPAAAESLFRGRSERVVLSELGYWLGGLLPRRTHQFILPGGRILGLLNCSTFSSLPLLRRDLYIVQLCQLGELSDDVLTVASFLSNRVLGEPNYSQVSQGNQVFDLVKTLDTVPANVQFFQVVARADVFKSANTVDGERENF